MVSSSYGGGRTGPVRSLVLPLADGDDVDHAITVGRAIRFARTLSAGTIDVLRTTRLELGKSQLTLHVPKGMGYLLSEEISRRFEVLARRLKRKPQIKD
jgi:hypothetical protein